MKTIIFGATGGTGAEIVTQLLAHGGTVTAFARDPARVPARAGLTVVRGDVMDRAAVVAALAGHDRVAVTLGNSQNPFAMMAGAKRTTARDVCEVGTANVIAGMHDAGVRRLVCVTAFGVGATRSQMPLTFRIFYGLVLREHMADKARQEALIRASGLDWTIVQPVGLTDGPATTRYVASSEGRRGKQTVSRADVAAYVIRAFDDASLFGQSVALSG